MMSHGSPSPPQTYKRLAEDDLEEIVPNKKSITTNSLHLKLLIHSNIAGALIGKGGQTMNFIQSEAKVKIKMSKNKEYFPGTQERVCLISGMKSCLLHAFDLLYKKIQEEKKVAEEQLKLIISDIFAGTIIGKNGSMIKLLKNDSNTLMEISKKNSSLFHKNKIERILTIYGKHANLLDALDRIMQLMESNTLLSIPHLNIHYDHVNWSALPLSSNPNENISIKRDNSIDVVNNINENSTVIIKNFVDALSSIGFGDQTLLEVKDSLCTLHKHGLLLICTSGILNYYAYDLLKSASSGLKDSNNLTSLAKTLYTLLNPANISK